MLLSTPISHKTKSTDRVKWITWIISLQWHLSRSGIYRIRQQVSRQFRLMCWKQDKRPSNNDLSDCDTGQIVWSASPKWQVMSWRAVVSTWVRKTGASATTWCAPRAYVAHEDWRVAHLLWKTYRYDQSNSVSQIVASGSTWAQTGHSVYAEPCLWSTGKGWPGLINRVFRWQQCACASFIWGRDGTKMHPAWSMEPTSCSLQDLKNMLPTAWC